MLLVWNPTSLYWAYFSGQLSFFPFSNFSLTLLCPLSWWSCPILHWSGCSQRGDTFPLPTTKSISWSPSVYIFSFLCYKGWTSISLKGHIFHLYYVSHFSLWATFQTLLLWLSHVGSRAGCPQNVSLWHVDYFELKWLEKQQTQKGFSLTPTLSSSLESRKEISHGKVLSLYLEVEWLPYHQRQGIKGQRNLYKQTCYFLLIYYASSNVI